MLDPKKKLAEMIEAYKVEDKYTNFLICGDMGTGKTHLLQTCPKPVFIQSFDPGGCNTLRDAITKGDIIVDNRFENENPDNPQAYALWVRETKALIQSDFFKVNGIKTWAIDSLTTFVESALLWCQAQSTNKRKTLGDKPEFDDYHLLAREMRDNLKVIVSAPVHVVVTSHLELKVNDDGRTISSNILVPGKLSIKVPLMFDEVYVTEVAQSPKGQTYNFLTQPKGIYKARTRLGSGGKLSLKEPMDISAILKKVGMLKGGD